MPDLNRVTVEAQQAWTAPNSLPKCKVQDEHDECVAFYGECPWCGGMTPLRQR